MSNRGFLAVMAAVAFVGLLGFGLIAKGGTELAIGEPAPDAPVERLDGDGQGSLADYRGKWLLVNFWASWCRPCEEESPTIQRYADEHRDDLVVIGINSEDNTEDATGFIEENGLSWEFFKDTNDDRAEDYGVLGLPESFVVDPDGNLALLFRGPIDRDYLDEYVTPLITAAEAPA